MTPWRRRFALFIAGVLAYGAAFAWYMLDRFDLVNLLSDVNEDDAFYYYQIAYHLAGGEFSTFDGGITRTNGYHPVWLLLITPFYWFFDKTEALFAIKAFEVMLIAGGVALVAGAARVARLPWILLFAVLPALYRIPAMLWGLEAAAALFMLGLFLLAVCLFARDPARWRWPLAAAAFALPWVRLEYVAVSVSATAALWFIEWSAGPVPHRIGGGREGGREGASRPPMRPGGSVPALDATAPLSGAVAGILAYFTWNAMVFGGLVPVSAATKQWWSQQHWEREGGYSLTENVHAFLRTGFFDDELLIALEVCVYVVVVWWFSRRSRGRDDRLLLAFLVGVSGLAAGHLAKFAQSVLTVDTALGTYPWYFVPAYLLGALVVPTRCYVAVWAVRRFLGPELRRAAGIPNRGIVAAGAIFLLATVDFTAPFRFVDGRREAVSLDWEAYVYASTMVMNRLLPEDSVVGSWDSGVKGYFSRFPVVNLDGLANSWDYLRARREGAGAVTNLAAVARGGAWWRDARREGAGAAVRQRYGITHVAQTGMWERMDALFEGQVDFPGARQRRFSLWLAAGKSRGGADRSAWFWERMEPHLERQADGVGVLVDGRLAQAFVRDCPDDTLAEWTWAGQEEPVRTSWRRTSIGYCISTIVLPPDARLPVRVAAGAGREYLAARVEGRRPAIDADFAVYLADNRLIYARKESCGPEDVDAGFYLHVEPVDPDDAPDGLDNLDFTFNDHRGVVFDGACLVEVPLPAYGIAEIRTGQRRAGGWGGRIEPAAMAAGEHLAARIEGRRPAIRSDFDVYLVENALIYARKESCGPEDVDAGFYLHVEPVDPDDAPDGLDNLDFTFDDHRGVAFDGACLVEVPLPAYGITEIRTGQRRAGGWGGRIQPAAMAAGEHLAARIEGRRPAVRSDFDVYLVENALIYARKESCGPEDVDAGFYLHVEPVDPDDAPDGLDNLDFTFDDHRGVAFDGACLVEVPLPAYGIAEIRTGQRRAAGWQGEIHVGPAEGREGRP